MRLWFVFNCFITMVLAIRLCKNCQFYMPERLGGNYEIGNYLGKCRKFGFVDTNTSEIEYTYSYIARSNENQCGKTAKYHQKRDREESFYSE